MGELKVFMKGVFCKAVLFLIISSSAFSDQYKNALVNRMRDFRNNVFENVHEGNDFDNPAIKLTEERTIHLAKMYDALDK